MNIKLQKSELKKKTTLSITGSKSESNRLLLLKALYPQITIRNLSNSDDSQLMQKALDSASDVVDIHHAGTAMRFLTAYFAIQNNRSVIITGSARMKERPIKILVDALRDLGADISYEGEKGYPPLKISGKSLIKNQVSLAANVSSQYISALLLVGSQLQDGITISLIGKITSVPYIKMTLSLLNQIGIKTEFIDNTIRVFPVDHPIEAEELTVESDWSSASYFFSIAALSDVGTEIKLTHYKKHSLQGDSVLVKLYESFGVVSEFEDSTLILKKVESNSNDTINFNLSNAPDIAQTIAVTAFALGVECKLEGLHTLKIKETDRLEALREELTKLGASITVTNDSLHLQDNISINKNITIATYNDHRMAMAFAPLALRVPITIEDADVVSKSYPDFWKDLEHIGFTFK